MKNIHIIPAKGSSSIHYNKKLGKFILDHSFSEGTRLFKPSDIHITSNEYPEEDDYCIVDGGLGRISVDRFNSFVKYTVPPEK